MLAKRFMEALIYPLSYFRIIHQIMQRVSFGFIPVNNSNWITLI